MADYNKEEIWTEFQQKQNMTTSELESWLDTEGSKNAGKEMDNGETVGHSAGRSILEIKKKISQTSQMPTGIVSMRL